ncbi:hypothetical protein [Natrinema salsiterrestre]|uniref:Rep protein n=1 Tax=Natrinema salsiterrestre TaxID=2950540 RepID=A0A9Q4Q276_9EURY|nr:hypothetical protein [Natrinema salsiterrestre]MDF9744527.1 hypothetical protein [Natrinema salsiterrestre]
MSANSILDIFGSKTKSITNKYSERIKDSSKVNTLLGCLEDRESLFRKDRTLKADYVGPSAKLAVHQNSNSFEQRPTTQADGCNPEPLDDSVEDHYRLYEPIADSAERVSKPRRYLDEETQGPKSAREAVKSYVEARHGENVSAEKNGFKKTRNWRANRQYRIGKEMDRQLLRNYDNPTTVLLSLRVSPGDRGRLTLLSGLHDAINPTFEQLRYRLQRSADAPLTASEWEYFAVLAGTEKRATPHLHIYVYCDGDVSRKRFSPVVEKFVGECPYAPDDMRGNSPKDGTISVRGNEDDMIPRMSDTPAESQGATYVLTQLPHLPPVDEMAQDELLHSSTVDAWNGNAFRRSSYTVWDDDDKPSLDEISDIRPT